MEIETVKNEVGRTERYKSNIVRVSKAIPKFLGVRINNFPIWVHLLNLFAIGSNLGLIVFTTLTMPLITIPTFILVTVVYVITNILNYLG